MIFLLAWWITLIVSYTSGFIWLHYNSIYNREMSVNADDQKPENEVLILVRNRRELAWKVSVFTALTSLVLLILHFTVHIVNNPVENFLVRDVFGEKYSQKNIDLLQETTLSELAANASGLLPV